MDVWLHPCLGCNWAGATGRHESKERMERFSPGSEPNVYNPSGCRVCADCHRQMVSQPLYCPLRVFHDMGPQPMRLAAIVGRERLNAGWACWQRMLRERGWPEITEGHWRRLVAFLQAEREPPRA